MEDDDQPPVQEQKAAGPATVEELTIARAATDRMGARRELKKEILTRGSWATLMYLYNEHDPKKDVWSGEKVAIVRYRKMKGSYRFQKEFSFSSAAQALQIASIIQKWIPAAAAGGDDAGD